MPYPRHKLLRRIIYLLVLSHAAVGTSRLYWTDYWNGKIWSVNVDGSDRKAVLTGLGRPCGVAVDTTNRKLYWTDKKAAQIWWSDLDGSHAQVLIGGGLGMPCRIAVDARSRMIYWADKTRIRRAAMLSPDSHADLTWSNGTIVETTTNESRRLSAVNESILDGTISTIEKTQTNESASYNSSSDDLDDSIKVPHANESALSNSSLDDVNGSTALDAQANESFAFGSNSHDTTTALAQINSTTVDAKANESAVLGTSSDDTTTALAQINSTTVDAKANGSIVLGSSSDGIESNREAAQGNQVPSTNISLDTSSSNDTTSNIANVKSAVSSNGLRGAVHCDSNASWDKDCNSSQTLSTETATVTRRTVTGNLLGKITDVKTGLIDVRGLAIDVKYCKIYWTEAFGGLWDQHSNLGRLWRADLDGNGAEIVSSIEGKPTGIAIDTAKDLLHVALYEANKIQRSKYHGQDRQDVPNTQSVVDSFKDHRTMDVAIDPDNEKLYWYSEGDTVIRQANLDGSNVQTLAKTFNRHVKSISLDYHYSGQNCIVPPTTTTTTTTTTTETFNTGCTKTANAAIAGHNTQQLFGKSVAECVNACLAQSGCKSMDYSKFTSECFLSDKEASDVGGLKTDYAGNPYDHYHCVSGRDSGTTTTTTTTTTTNPTTHVAGTPTTKFLAVSVQVTASPSPVSPTTSPEDTLGMTQATTRAPLKIRTTTRTSLRPPTQPSRAAKTIPKATAAEATTSKAAMSFEPNPLVSSTPSTTSSAPKPFSSTSAPSSYSNDGMDAPGVAGPTSNNRDRSVFVFESEEASTERAADDDQAAGKRKAKEVSDNTLLHIGVASGTVVFIAVSVAGFKLHRSRLLPKLPLTTNQVVPIDEIQTQQVLPCLLTSLPNTIKMGSHIEGGNSNARVLTKFPGQQKALSLKMGKRNCPVLHAEPSSLPHAHSHPEPDSEPSSLPPSPSDPEPESSPLSPERRFVCFQPAALNDAFSLPLTVVDHSEQLSEQMVPCSCSTGVPREPEKGSPAIANPPKSPEVESVVTYNLDTKTPRPKSVEVDVRQLHTPSGFHDSCRPVLSILEADMDEIVLEPFQQEPVVFYGPHFPPEPPELAPPKTPERKPAEVVHFDPTTDLHELQFHSSLSVQTDISEIVLLH